MHLITPLIAGINGAENGTAQIFKRDSTTAATYYTDFEGTSAVSNGAAFTLDANGGFEAYVDELVTVIVKDSDGDTLRTFVAGAATSGVEVKSQSFTGTSYADANGATVSAASQPTTEQAVLDLWKTQQKSIDWKVLFGGNEVTIHAALASIAGMFFNVKDPAYGALGDGANDDTSAIQAAINAANTAGGGIVFFPAGTYLVTSSLTCHDGVSMWGVSTGGSILTMDHASNDLLSFSGPDTAATGLHDYTTIRDLTLKASQACSGNMIVASAGGLRLENLKIGDGTNAQGALVSDSGGCQWNIINCTFALALNTQIATVLRNASSRTNIVGCWFTPVATGASTSGIIDVTDARITNCHFMNSLATSGTVLCIRVAATTVVTGCVFENGGGATVTALETASLASDETLTESGNVFGDTVIKWDFTSGTDERKVFLGSRDYAFAEVSNGTASESLAADQYGHILLIQSAAAVTINLVDSLAQAPEGATFYLTVNASGTDVTITAGTRMNLAVAGIAVVSQDDVTVFQFKAMVVGGNSDVEWYQVGTAQDVNET